MTDHLALQQRLREQLIEKGIEAGRNLLVSPASEHDDAQRDAHLNLKLTMKASVTLSLLEELLADYLTKEDFLRSLLVRGRIYQPKEV